MTRVKSPSARNHRKTLKAAKGYRQARSKHIKVAKEAVMHAGQYAFEGRKKRKRDFRKLWIIRINAAVKKHNLSYSKFSLLLKKSGIELNRKMLSEIAVNHPNDFDKIIETIKK